MKYLCLIFVPESALEALCAGGYAPLEDECVAYEELLRSTGRLLAAEALQPLRAATFVRVRNGQIQVDDGPPVAEREQLAGFYLIDARDLNDAIRLATRFPAARLGCIEVRPIRAVQ